MGKKSNIALGFMRNTMKGRYMIKHDADHITRNAIEEGHAILSQTVAKPKKQRMKVKRKNK